jgi:hypothetical protein
MLQECSDDFKDMRSSHISPIIVVSLLTMYIVQYREPGQVVVPDLNTVQAAEGGGGVEGVSCPICD